jgi:hypothetical protein
VLAHLWALCDSLKAAVQAAQPTWTVAVLLDPQTPAQTHPRDEDAVEVHIGPLIDRGERGSDEDKGGKSRVRMDCEKTIAVRMRTRRVHSATEALSRSKCLNFDEILGIAERRGGLSLQVDGEEIGVAVYVSYLAYLDQESLREDSLISIVAELTFALTRRSA